MPVKEQSAVLSLAAIMAFRLFGLFIILPIFSVNAEHLVGATPTLIGLALGIYGLTQALLQIPFGALSDHMGRKPVIAMGLIVFALGSAIAALSHSITTMILGRAIQGAGAIGSTVLALVADLTLDEHRGKAMAMMGLTIGFTFALAMIVGPVINSWLHLSGVFWTTASSALFGLLLLFTTVPTPPQLVIHNSAEPDVHLFKAVLSNLPLVRLDWGIFSLHTMLTAMFIAIPIILTRGLNLSEPQQMWLYLIALIFAFIVMVPLIAFAEKKRHIKPVFIGAIATIISMQLLLMLIDHSAISIGICLLIFFAAFTFLEASLPSLVSKVSPLRNKGTAMGVYSTAQFLGIFVGGSAGGWIYSHFHITGIFVFCVLIGLSWLAMAITMPQPPYLSTVIMSLPPQAHTNPALFSQQCRAIPGVAEVAIMSAEKLVYFKVDKQFIDESELRNKIKHSNVTAV